MKVLLFNGSPNAKGCTYTALCEVSNELLAGGIQTEIFSVGKKPIIGCTACNSCRNNNTGECVFKDDGVNAFIEKAKTADGFILASPVHYSACSGAATSFLDRVFYADNANFAYKPGAGVVSSRRAGSTSALEQLIKYFTISNMPVVSSQYWNMVHGTSPEEVVQDVEGMQIMRTLGKNMVWLLKLIEAGKQQGIPLPVREEKIFTNFIR